MIKGPHPRSQDQQPCSIAGLKGAQAIIFLSGPAIETMVSQKLYVDKGDALRDRKRSESKPLFMTLQSRDYIASYPRSTRGLPLGIKSH